MFLVAADESMDSGSMSSNSIAAGRLVGGGCGSSSGGVCMVSNVCCDDEIWNAIDIVGCLKWRYPQELGQIIQTISEQNC